MDDLESLARRKIKDMKDQTEKPLMEKTNYSGHRTESLLYGYFKKVSLELF